MPGVPPDALDNLKRAFKGLFKRNKKSKPSTPTSTTPSQLPQSATGSEATAPQLPPIQNNSPLQSTTETSKPLPPTHPLATGQHEQVIEAVPPNRDAQPGPPAPIVGPAETAEQVQEQRKQTTSTSSISPQETHSAVDGARDGDVSAVTNEGELKEPAKTDSGIEEMKVEEPSVTTSEQTTNVTNVDPNTTTTTTSTTEDKSALPSAPNGTPSSALNGTPAPASDKPGEASPTSAEEKVALIHDEPPPIKVAKPAPGMSATSGPLEDFPEGGDL